MNVITCGLSTHRWEEQDGRLDRVRVEPTVDFLIDGRSVRDLLSDAGQEHIKDRMITPFEGAWDRSAVDIMRGERRYEDWQEPDGRIPVLVCPCGDLACGAVTAAIDVAETVIWRDWAWENYYEPARPIEGVPSVTFTRANYEAAMNDAEELARAQQGAVESVIEVREAGFALGDHLPWSRRPGGATVRRMLENLHARAVEPTLQDASGAYADFLVNLDEVQSLLAGWYSIGSPRPEHAREEVLRLIGQLLASEYLSRLPGSTITAIEWFQGAIQGAREAAD